jgi:hypothetical protein
MLPDGHATQETLRAGSFLLLGSKDNPHEDDAVCMFSVLDLEAQMVLPKYVCFKGDNGQYLRAVRLEGYNYLQFSSDDIADPGVGNVIQNNNDGTIGIYSSGYGKFWRRSPNWIYGDSNDSSNRNPDTVFKAIFLGDAGKCALQNLGNNHFCKRLTTEGKTSCLNAAVATITREAQLEVQETVLSRRIYDVEYRLEDANIHGLRPRTFYSNAIANATGTAQTSKLTITYDVATETRWDASVSLKIGVKTTIKAGVPLIGQAKIQISAEFTGSYSWGETKSHTEHYSNEEDVEVPAHTEVTVRVVATEGTCDIPFSYTQEDLLTTGETVITRMDDGIYRGVSSYGFQTEISEKNI